jgi:hypothetical protein
MDDAYQPSHDTTELLRCRAEEAEEVIDIPVCDPMHGILHGSCNDRYAPSKDDEPIKCVEPQWLVLLLISRLSGPIEAVEGKAKVCESVCRLYQQSSPKF